MPQNSTANAIKLYKKLFLIALSVFVLDQLTKAWVVANIDYGIYHPTESIEIIPDFFYLVHIGNPGAAWGIFSGYSSILAVFAIVALAAIYIFREALELRKAPMQIAFGLIIGGVIGNFLDRILYKHVVDFLDFHLPFSIPRILEGGRYPSFNIADCGIVIGVFFYIFLTLKSEEKTSPKETAKP